MADYQLYQGDCMDYFKTVEDESVDLILADLPYGTTFNKWDTPLDLPKLWAEYKRMLKKHGAILLFGQGVFTAKLITSQPKLFRYNWVWRKNNATGFLNARKMPLKAHETVSVFYKALPTYNPQKIKGEPYKRNPRLFFSPNYQKATTGGRGNPTGERFPVDVLEFPKVNHTIHPTQKPVALCEYFIKTYTNAGDLVLDNTAGSGTTGVAAVKLGRKFIGMEKEPKYFAMMQQRIKEAEQNVLHHEQCIE